MYELTSMAAKALRADRESSSSDESFQATMMNATGTIGMDNEVWERNGVIRTWLLELAR